MMNVLVQRIKRRSIAFGHVIGGASFLLGNKKCLLNGNELDRLMPHLFWVSEEEILFDIENAIQHHPVNSFHFLLNAAVRFER